VNESVKFFFDECIGAKVAHDFGRFLQDIYGTPHEIKHISEILKLGITDDIWVPEIAAAGFIAITSDRSKDPKGAKLKLLGIKFGLTNVMLASSVHHLKTPAKIRALTDTYEKIIEVVNAPKGTRFMMAMSTGPVPRMWEVEVTEAEKAEAAKYNVPPEPFQLKG
jgi:hypothetical protein